MTETMTQPEPEATEDHEHLSDYEKRHYDLILETSKEVNERLLEWNDAKQVAADAKKAYEKINESLLFLISKGPNPQGEFDFDAEGADADILERPLAVLGLGESLLKTLEEEGGFESLGQLRDYWNAGNDLTNLAGFGPEKSAEVADAFAAYMAQHDGWDESAQEEPSEESDGSDSTEEPEAAA